MEKSVALVLTSGAARGIAQIGAIEELVKRGYTFTVIAGSSMGSVVGGFYAAGKLDVFKEWIITLDRGNVINLMDFTFNSMGFIRGAKVYKQLYEMLGDTVIESLDTPFVAVATDITNGRELWIKQGSLMRALRASTAIPSVVTPAEHEGAILVDGGAVNPMPIEPILGYDHDHIVVIDVSAKVPLSVHLDKKKFAKDPVKEEQFSMITMESLKEKWLNFLDLRSDRSEKKNYFSLINSSFTLMEQELVRLKKELYKPDLVINISKEIGGTFEFHRAEEFIEYGREAAAKALDEKEGKWHIDYTSLNEEEDES